MCGIFGIAGQTDVAELLVEGLARLEYRGYDSCGLAVLGADEALSLRKGVGEVSLVRREERFAELSGTSGLGHTRWATHGRVSQVNSHPHANGDGRIAIVHNGILENHDALRHELVEHGYVFHSETDSEVVAHLIDHLYRESGDFGAAVRATVLRLEGTYGLGVISSHCPGTLYAVRLESPLILGLGDDFTCFASDILAFHEVTDQVVFLGDGEMVEIDRDGYHITQVKSGKPVRREPITIAEQQGKVELAGFRDYMSKEIQENGTVTRVALSIDDAHIDAIVEAIRGARQSYLTGIGTSYYVAVIAQYLFSQLTGRFFPALSSDELPYLASFAEGEHVIAISQSGETYDTLKALRRAQERGATTSAVVNVATSSMAREVDRFVDQQAGPEICVLSTKSTVSQLAILTRVALRLAEVEGTIPAAEIEANWRDLRALPGLLEQLWHQPHDRLRDVARRFSVIRNWFFLGRGVYHGVALEAALKFKEVTYCHAEGMPAGALKHGTISLIDEAMHSAVFLPSRDDTDLRTQTLGAVAEINARGGSVVAFQPEGIGDPEKLFAAVIEFPEAGSLATPFLALMQAQKFAYYTARALGRNVDKPRSLAKSVTVG